MSLKSLMPELGIVGSFGRAERIGVVENARGVGRRSFADEARALE
jgi:hypothetical protein